jgi:signal transduction histidine kinase/ActR/RegA family two-component response regulator
MDENKKIFDAFNSLDASVLAFDMEGDIFYINKSVEKLIKSFPYLNHPFQDYEMDGNIFLSDGITPLPLNDHPVSQVLKGKRVGNFEIMAHASTDNSFWLDVTGTPIIENEKQVGGVMFFKTTTSYKETILLQEVENVKLEMMQKRLLDAERKLKQASHAKTLFLANMSHEIRTPMNAIVGFTELVSKTDLNIEQSDYISMIQDSGNFLLKIINDILDITKIESGEMTLETLNVEITKLVTQIIKTYNKKAKENNTKIHATIDSSVPECIKTDPLRLSQVITNLLNNAIKFTKDGNIYLNVNNQDDLIVIEIVDEGIGIKEEAIDSIFSKFTQADTSTCREYGGTGLGLAICKQIVELMNGVIKVSSDFGKGTTFRFYFPLVRGEKKVHIENSIDQEEQLEVYSDLKILLVEDNLINQKVATKLLEKIGAENVTIANQGLEALEILSTKEFDIIFMDIMMPEIDGYETTKKIRERGLTSDKVKIIALTANATEEDRQKCLSVGMDDYLPKPFRMDKLRSIINVNIVEKFINLKKTA